MIDNLLAPAAQNLSLARIGAVLLARWKAVVGVTLSVLALALLLCWILPAKYTAFAVVVIDLKTADPVAGFSPGMMQPTYMGTQVEMLQSERVVLRALQSLRVLDSPELRAQWREVTDGAGDYNSWVVAVFSRKLDIKPGRDSNIIEVHYTWTDPGFAAAMANAVVKAYLETSAALQTGLARHSNALLDERSKKLRSDLEDAQNKLSAYEQKNGLVASDDRIDVESARLAELSSQQVSLQAVLSESKSRAKQAGRSLDQSQEVLLNPLVSDLSAAVAQQEASLGELTARLGERHPQVVQVRAHLAELRGKLSATMRRVTASLDMNETVNQTRLNEVQAALTEQRDKVQKLRALRDSGRVLQRDVENAQQAFQVASARLQQSELTSQNTQTNALVLKEATIPGLPSFPKWPLIILVAVFIGALLGVAWALLRETMNERLRVDSDVIGLGIPLLTVLPNHRNVERKLARPSIGARLSDLRPKRLSA